jgi:hypothetical protein
MGRDKSIPVSWKWLSHVRAVKGLYGTDISVNALLSPICMAKGTLLETGGRKKYLISSWDINK